MNGKVTKVLTIFTVMMICEKKVTGRFSLLYKPMQFTSTSCFAVVPQS